jgi:hypothetical protein
MPTSYGPVRNMRRVVLGTLALLLLVPAPARASSTMESMFQDDDQLIYTTPAKRKARIRELARLGVDRIRVTIVWRAIAPDAESAERPRHFDATDPDAYSPGVWENYDNLVKRAYARGIGVNFNVTAPSPTWANQPSPREDLVDVWEPRPLAFEHFVMALGRRYSGHWPDGHGGELPRVDFWSIWNEPNISGWLAPTWDRNGSGPWFGRAASLYRSLLDAAFTGLRRTGHRKDAILFGETAPKGNDQKPEVKRTMSPLFFLRALYCVDDRLRRLRGRAARRLDCGNSRSEFVDAHPALFRATGYAHHPYQLAHSPTARPSNPDWVTIGTLSRLKHVLDTVQARYGSSRRFPIYLTEFGYQTVPDALGVSLRQQARYINQSDFIAAHDPRVVSIAQFLLRDGGPPIEKTFQTGLETRRGDPKPAYAAYRLPIWVTGDGAAKRVWGMARAATHADPDYTTSATVRIEFRPRGASSFSTIGRVEVYPPGHQFAYSVTPGAGELRLAYGSLHSRIVTVE